MRAQRSSQLTNESTISARLAVHRPPPSPCPNLLNHGLQRYLSTCSIAVPKFAPWWSLNASPNSLDCILQVHTIMTSKCISKLARAWARSASLCSPAHGLQVYLQIRSITTSMVIFKLSQSRPWSVSLSSFVCHFQAHHKFLLNTACIQSRYPVCRWVAIETYRWEYKLNTWVSKIVEW